MKKVLLGFILIIGIFVINQPLSAQCPMCKSSVESSLKDGSSKAGAGLNNGILYLLAAPYLLCTILGVIWYRNYRRKPEIEINDTKITMN